MSTKTVPLLAALAAALIALGLAGCGRRAEQATSAGPTPGAADSAVHVAVDTVSKPTPPVRPFEPVAIPGQSSGSESSPSSEASEQSTPSTTPSPSVSAAPATPDTTATPHKPKVKRRTPK